MWAHGKISGHTGSVVSVSVHLRLGWFPGSRCLLGSRLPALSSPNRNPPTNIMRFLVAAAVAVAVVAVVAVAGVA